MNAEEMKRRTKLLQLMLQSSPSNCSPPISIKFMVVSWFDLVVQRGLIIERRGEPNRNQTLLIS